MSLADANRLYFEYTLLSLDTLKQSKITNSQKLHIRLLRQQALVRSSKQPSRRSPALRPLLDRRPIRQHGI